MYDIKEIAGLIKGEIKGMIVLNLQGYRLFSCKKDEITFAADEKMLRKNIRSARRGNNSASTGKFAGRAEPT